MDEIAAALIELADIAACVSGDFHTLHLNMSGDEFDTMHKKVLQKYYEEAADDYDAWAEAAGMFEGLAPNVNEAATRIGWKSFEGATAIDRATAVREVDGRMSAYLDALVPVFAKLNSNMECPMHIGIANTIQTRIEYWAKEYAYFNKRRAQ
jgi:DNA-binding ferritin-like protein